MQVTLTPTSSSSVSTTPLATGRSDADVVPDAGGVNNSPATPSGFDTTAVPLVELSPNGSAPTGVGETLRVSVNGDGLVTSAPAGAGIETESGGKLAEETMAFRYAHLHHESYRALTFTFDGATNQALANDVKADAMAYIANTPGLATACERVIAACDAIPAKVERLKVDFALNHFATVGAANGLSWGKTQAEVEKMLSTTTPPPTIQYDTAGKSEQTLARPVSGGSAGRGAFINVDGSKNTIDFCTKPYPPPSARGDAVLGGTENSGQVDLVGTIVIRTGRENTWTINDPSKSPSLSPPWNELGAACKQKLAENAKGYRIVLEGNSSDYSVHTDGLTSTYRNNVTNTSVTIPAGAQPQVSYLPTSEIDALAASLKAGTAAPGQPGVAPKPQPQPRPAGGGVEAEGGGSGGVAPPPPRPAVDRTPPALPHTGLDALVSFLVGGLSRNSLALLLKHLGITVSAGESLESIKAKLAQALQEPGGQEKLAQFVAERMRSAQEASNTRDPIDWYVNHAGKDKQSERDRWAKEGKTRQRVREELGSWQKRETSKLVNEALVLAFTAGLLSGTVKASGGDQVIAAHLESIASAPHAPDGQWDRPLDTLPLNIKTAMPLISGVSGSASRGAQARTERG